MNAGKLRHRVTIEAKSDGVQDTSTGEVTAEWVPVVLGTWAEIRPMSVREYLAAQAMQSRCDTMIVVRARTDVDATMRVRKLPDGPIYAITGVLPDAKYGNEYLTLACSSGVNAGD
jgi:SPP1 family predicted phage head-tail adaptor